jgi:hypothetical protein
MEFLTSSRRSIDAILEVSHFEIISITNPKL